MTGMPVDDSVDNRINLVKLCVGADSPEALAHWRAARKATDPRYICRHVTRMWPKRASELLAGGSLYWVFKGQILARQRLLRLDEVIGEDGIRRCGLVLDEDIIRTAPAPRRPFQGWRYLSPQDAPPDLAQSRENEPDLPPDLIAALSELGVG